MSAIGAFMSYGSMSGYNSIYQNRNANQNQNVRPTSTEPVSAVSRAQTTPVPPVDRTPTVQRGADQTIPKDSPFLFPTMREGADPAEMAVRSRIQYLDNKVDGLEQELLGLNQSDGLEKLLNRTQEKDSLASNPEQDVVKTEQEDAKSPQEVVEESECETCKNRKYQDGSDEMVSFKSAAHISPAASASRVRAHEQEHVNNAYSKAAKNNGKVLSASVALKSAVCPECGRSYVAGGTTTTQIKYSDESNPYTQNKKSQDALSLIGNHLDLANHQEEIA